MNKNVVARHEANEGRARMNPDGPAECAVAFEGQPADMGRNELLPSDAYRRVEALLAVYRSRVDFLKHSEIDNASERLRYRVKKLAGAEQS